MAAYVVRRIIQVVFVVWGGVTVLFFLFFLLPGDPANIIAGGSGRAIDPQVVQNVREKCGLDDSALTQYSRYLKRLATADLGTSCRSNESINDMVKTKGLNSIRLAFWAILIEIVFGIGAGILSAVRKYSFADGLTTVLAASLSAIPVFVLALLAQQIFAVQPFKHGWPDWARLRVQGMGDNTWALGVIPTGSTWRALILPALVLASVSTAVVARMTRTTMLEVQKADFMRTARAKGLTEYKITMRHGLRNAMIPVITLIGIDLGLLVGSAILTETVFNWDGLGSRIADAAQQRDLWIMSGLSLVVITAYAIINLCVDLSYAWFDPRVRVGRGAK